MLLSGCVIVTVFILTFVEIQCARILVYIATPSISHQIVFRPLTQALAARGHEVFFITTDPAFPKGKAPANLTEIDVGDVSYEIMKDLHKYHRGNKEDFILEIKLMFEKFATITDNQLQKVEVKEILKKGKNYFDILLIESCNRVLMGLAHKFDAPVVFVSSFGAISVQYSVLGAPLHLLLYPTAERQKLYNLSPLEKVIEIMKYVFLHFLFTNTEEFDMKVMKKNFGADTPSFEELTKRIQAMFLNEHPVWAGNRPVPPSIIYMGGIHKAVQKDLPSDLKKYLDLSKHGVIYVSFGTNVLPSELPQEKIQMMTKVFSELPYDVLWKYDKDQLLGHSKNIKISKWFPQQDLLKHPKIKLFITQGGLQSTDEAIDAAVPLIGIPLSSDQWYNVEKYVHHKIGLQLDITTLNESELKESIEKVIKDESFKNNATRLRALMREYPIDPLELTVWWTEHIIKYGASHLQSPAANMSWIEYYEIKLVLIVLSIVVVILFISVLILKSICKFIYKICVKQFKIKKH